VNSTAPPLSHRLEDRRLITGAGRFVSDLIEPDDLHAHFYRSPIAHGAITSVDVGPAMGSAGVELVLTGDDIRLPPIAAGPHAPEGMFGRPLLAKGKVRYVGDPVAVVVAGSKQAAVDAVGTIWADIEPLETVVDPRSAADGSPLFEQGNVVFQETLGSAISDRSFPMRATVTVRNQRLAPAPIEGLAIRAAPGGDGTLVVHCGHQAPHRLRGQLARQLEMAEERIRVVVPDVGGAFGMKGMLFPEYVVVAASALRLGSPVAWIEERREHFQSGTHGRGQTHVVTLEGESDGRVRRARIEILSDLGAYPHNGSHIPFLSTYVAQGPYDIEEVSVAITGVVTNLAPTGSYRGAGRPEAAYAIERAIDEFAIAIGLSPEEARSRNFVRPDQLPYSNQTGGAYDSGNYGRALEMALEVLDVDAARAEQQRRHQEGLDPIGVGIGAFIEKAGGADGSGEFAGVRLRADGTVEVLSGSTSSGQGHETVWPQLVAPMFGIDPEGVSVVAGDTGRVAEGVGTFGSRSAQLTGSALVRTAARVVEEMKERAAALLEVGTEDLMLGQGTVHVVGDAESAIPFTEIGAVESSEMFTPDSLTWPYGAHVAVVEVSLETGELRLLEYVAVDDCGNVLNPMIVEGQVVGSLVQGFGAATLEGIEYSPDGDPITATFMDYLIPAAMDAPHFTLGRIYNPAPSNPLGAKGTGEAGCIGSPPAIVNAALDALRPYGVTDLQMPLRPHHVWEAIRRASVAGD
jgi:CO/xanthine dehydrogenase Mo-binding subunit